MACTDSTREASHGELTYQFSPECSFVWERLQPTANGPLATAYAAKLEALVNYITSKGANVLLNPQNFARYYNNVIGSAQVPNSVFADFWRRVADTYKTNPRVMFGLVNEPHDLPVTQWVDAANAAIVGIRATGATNLITVPNINYTGAWTWTNNGNGDAMLHIKDSGDNFVYEAHQYLDFDGSGAHPTCVSSTVGKDRIVNFVHWLRDNKKKGLFGEFAAANNTTCETAIKGMLQYMADNADVVVGWLWWAAGPWWPADYILSLEKRSDGTDAPQMAWLTPHLKKVTAKIRITYDWTNVPGFADGYCAEVDGYNWAGIRNITLSYTDINLYDAVTYAEWNGTFSSHTGAARVTPPAGMIIAPNGNVKALGLCANKGPTAKKLTVTNIVGN
jgi:endoglucanase